MSDSPPPATLLVPSQRLERFTAWPVFVASLLFFGATVALVSGSLRSEALSHTASAVAVTCYVLMVADFLARMVVARGVRGHFLRRNWFEMLSLVLPVLRSFVIVVHLWRLPYFRRSGATLRARLLATTFLFMFLFVYTVSSAVWLVERDAPGANILSLDDAIWWGFSTLATVGYGDFVPVTGTGRVLAVGLMVGGIAIVGSTAALVVSLLTEQVQNHGVMQPRAVGADPEAASAGVVDEGPAGDSGEVSANR
ncbi:potassium channel family protein [Dietzia sp. UBA5065]|uniref:potassium channel family protein n=1 Tax=Dietzia sp. UBA5065 TaxID=1946422 RepID=UPI0025C2443C|nr:potassium channel family protein [Dietzia sp. UBA5065]